MDANRLGRGRFIDERKGSAEAVGGYPDNQLSIPACALPFGKEEATMIALLREKISVGAFEFSKHALDKSIIRRVFVDEIRQAIANGEVIEDYPLDKYGPSCLIFGFTSAGRPLHV